MAAPRRPLDRPSISTALDQFRAAGGLLRTRDALRAGIHPRTLYELRDGGRIELLERGLYRLAEAPSLGYPDLVIVAVKIPRGVLCLISALAWYELTAQVPHQIEIALPRGSEPPRLGYPPLQTVWFSGAAYSDGIESHQIDHVTLRVYCREKTIADCFKYRHQIGLDTVIEALKRYRSGPRFDMDALLHYAGICRVRQVIQPYLEALL